MKKGIITAPGKITVENNNFSVVPLSSNDIKFLTLYWDKIVIPESNLIRIGYPYSNDLIKCGIVTEIDAMQGKQSGSGGEIASNIINTQYDYLNVVNKHPDIDWAIHQSGSEIIGKQNTSLTPSIHEQQIIKFTLKNCLPVPHEDIPLCEILEFKERRKDELTYLHDHMDKLYQEILSAGDTNLANKTALRDLRNNISDIRKTSRESFSIIRNMDLTALQVMGISSAALGGYHQLGALGLIGGALSGAILCETSTKMISTRIEDRKKFKYLTSASRDRIIGEI